MFLAVWLQALAQEVACYLGLDLSSIKIKRFADGEIYVQVQVGIKPLALVAWTVDSCFVNLMEAEQDTNT